MFCLMITFINQITVNGPFPLRVIMSSVQGQLLCGVFLIFSPPIFSILSFYSFFYYYYYYSFSFSTMKLIAFPVYCRGFYRLVAKLKKFLLFFYVGNKRIYHFFFFVIIEQPLTYIHLKEKHNFAHRFLPMLSILYAVIFFVTSRGQN